VARARSTVHAFGAVDAEIITALTGGTSGSCFQYRVVDNGHQ
jgi:hypothetical protein